MPAAKQPTRIRQDAIARAALEIVASHGMKGLSVAAVARRVGIVPSGIYRHYRGKDEIIDAILAFLEQRLSTNVAAVRQEGDALARLHGLLGRHLALLRDNAAIPVVVLSPEVHSGSPARRARLLAILQGYLAAIAALVVRGQREGAFRPELDPDSVAVLFLGMVQSPVILWHLSRGDFDVARQAEAAWPLFARAIRATPEPTPESQP